MTDKTLIDFAADSDLLGFARAFKDKMHSLIEARIEEVCEPLPVINEDTIHVTSEAERDALLIIRQTARTLGGDEGTYNEGLFEVELTSKRAAEDFCVFLETCEAVEEYEVEVYHDNEIEEIEFDDIEEGDNVKFEFAVYLIPDIVIYAPGIVEDGEGDEYVDIENGVLAEVKRVIKVNFRGKRKVKMQCNPGFRWDPGTRSCKKITGADLANKRKALRKASRTKKALGSGFKVRVKRKTRKALRFRKSMGLS